jgi:hypothetical protein
LLEFKRSARDSLLGQAHIEFTNIDNQPVVDVLEMYLPDQVGTVHVVTSGLFAVGIVIERHVARQENAKQNDF